MLSPESDPLPGVSIANDGLEVRHFGIRKGMNKGWNEENNTKNDNRYDDCRRAAHTSMTKRVIVDFSRVHQ